MPNGDSVNFPDTMPKDQIKSMILKKFPDAGNKQPQKETQSPQDKGLIGNIAQDVGKRFDTGMDIMKSDQNPLSKGLQMAGKVVAGTANDIMGEAAKSAYNTLPDTWKEKVSGGVQKAMNTSMGKAALEAAQKGGLAYVTWAKEHPEAAANIESLVDIATVIPGAKVAGAIGKVAGKAAGAVADVTPVVAPIKKGVEAAKTLEKTGAGVNQIVDTLHKQATQTIEAAKNSGIKFKPGPINDLTTKLDSISQLTTAGERAKESGTVDLLSQMKDSVLGPLDKKTGARNASKADTSLRNLIGWSDALRPLGKKETSALSAKNIIDNFIGDHGDYPKFKQEWGRYKTGQAAAAAAELADESSAKSRAAFSKIMDSKYFSSLSPELQKSIKLASKGKASGKFMDAVGSVKGLVGASIEAGAALYAGHPIGLAAIAGSLGANKGGKLIQRGLGGDVLKTIRDEK